MKIAFVIQDLFCQGAQASTAMMVRGFISKGYDVDLIVSRIHDDYRREHRPGEFKVPESTNWIFLKNRKARKNIFELRRYLCQTEAYAVIAMSPTYTKALRIAAIGLLHCPKLIHVEHGLASCNDKGERIPARRKLSLAALFGLWFWARFYKIFVVSSAAVEDFRSVYPWCTTRQFHVVHNPVIGVDFFDRANKPALHPWLLDKKCKTFVTAGAYVPNKGHMTILRAFAELPKRRITARLIVFGCGELEQEYNEFIAKNSLEDTVSIAGFTHNILAEECASDGYILSSETESFGIALVEAMACGCPIVATDAPFGPREILQGGRYGRLVPIGDYMAMADAIEDLCHDKIPAPPPESWGSYTISSTVEKYERGLGVR